MAESALDKSIKSRIAARGWVTRASKVLEAKCKEKGVDKIELEDVIQEFDKRLCTLDNKQSEVECELDLANLEADIDKAAEFRIKAREPRILAGKIRSRLSTPVDDDVASRVSVTSIEAKLPKLELPKFGGEATEWPGFWDQFSAIIGNSELPDITKFTYLQSLLHGEAKASIQGLSLTASHYNIACEILKKRFGRKERIIFAHIQDLLCITVPKSSDVVSLWKLQDTLHAHIRSLEALGIDGHQYGVILTPLILSKLPTGIRLEWAREGEGHENELEWLLEFLQKEIQRRERSQTFKDDAKSELTAGKQVKDSERRATVTALHSQSTGLCGFCGRRHATEKCWDINKLSVSERKEKIWSKGLCFRCLSDNHIAKQCEAKCAKCKGRHNSMICNVNVNQKTEPKVVQTDVKTVHHESEVVAMQNIESQAVQHANVSHIGVCHGDRLGQLKSRVVLQTVQVQVVGTHGKCTNATVLFDTGSDRSYVSSELVNKIDLEWVGAQPVSYAAFGATKPSKGQLRNVYQVDMKCLDNSVESAFVTEIPVICAPVYIPEIQPEILQSFSGLNLAASYNRGEEVTIDILVGLDVYWKLVKPGIRSVTRGLVAQDTVFGWILSGICNSSNTPGPNTVQGGVSHQLLCLNDISEEAVRRFWDLESVGVSDKQSNLSDPTLVEFERCISLSEGRYEVALPWKQGDQGSKRLINNESLARKRLDSLSKRLARDPDLEERYNEALQEMENIGVTQEVVEGEMTGPYPIYYMPHRPVVRESSVSTKVRPVFDASSPGHNGVSLNDCLKTGPSLISDLPGILVRFRRWKVAITADITKAFLQIKVRRPDQDVHRFLWRVSGRIRVMRFTRVPFGNKSSPFLLNATLKHHLASFPPTRVVSELEDNLYVDDWLTGADDDQSACDMLAEVVSIMDQASMPMAKWSSNSSVFADKLYRVFHEKYMEEETVKVLGIKWMPTQDKFSFEGIEIPEGLVITKRVVLSFIARLYDPLGFLTPYTMLVKVLFQKVWKLGLTWDEEIPKEDQKVFGHWIQGMEILRAWQIPRSYTGRPWSDNVQVTLHAFGDASERGYGSCVYLVCQFEDGFCCSSLVVSKARVAPLKKITLPRLELLGALLCAQLVTFVKDALRLSPEIQYYCWTDSMVALSWIKSDPNKWKVFVSNRVVQIQELTSPENWFFCSGKFNPADLVTRGLFADELVKSELWLYGPEFLQDTLHLEDSVDLGLGKEDADNESLSSAVNLVTSDISKKAPVFESDRWSCFTKTIRIVGWVLRFLENLKSLKSKQRLADLSFEELDQAKLRFLHYVQEQEYAAELSGLRQSQSVPKSSSISKLSPFIGEGGFLRVGGRIQFSELSYEEKHPIILPKVHASLLLVRFHHQLMKHAGVATMIASIRNHYWIIGLRKLAKKVKRECIACQKQDSVACSQPMAPLPRDRVVRSPPFSVTGTDYAGPLYCSDIPKKKFYVLLFTCAVVRAVHLELVDSMSIEDCMLAIRRFVARRSLPSIIYSDNAKTFVAAQGKLIKLYGHLSPQWKFIPPRSPWWGGWWERLVRTIKAALKKSLGSRSLTRSELETVLQEVESCVNSRPLTFLGDEVSYEKTLTPADFLMSKPVGSEPTKLTEQRIVTAEDLVVKHSAKTHLLNYFWSLWSTEYIRNLPTWHGSEARGGLHKGSLVLIRNEGHPRSQWPLGVVIEMFPGKDGVTRVVKVKTNKGVFTRSVQLLHELEIANGANDLQTTETSASSAGGVTPNPTNETDTLDNHHGDMDMASKDSVKYRTSRYGREIKPVKKLDL